MLILASRLNSDDGMNVDDAPGMYRRLSGKLKLELGELISQVDQGLSSEHS